MNDAIATEHESTHHDGTIMRTRWFATEVEAWLARADYLAQGAQASEVRADGGCLGRYRVWAHFAPSPLRWSTTEGAWVGGEPRALYHFTERSTGRKVVTDYLRGPGPAWATRLATRQEAADHGWPITPSTILAD